MRLHNPLNKKTSKEEVEGIRSLSSEYPVHSVHSMGVVYFQQIECHKKWENNRLKIENKVENEKYRHFSFKRCKQ